MHEPRGLCSTYLSSLAIGSTVRVSITPSSTMMLPADIKTPIVMIAGGTGIAPFLAFLEKRSKLSRENLGTALLFFGCKHADYDFLYEDLLDSYVDNGCLTKVIPAFSRMESNRRDGDKGCYVQDILIDHKSEVKSLLNDKGNIYICGSRKMGEAVRSILSAQLGGDAYINNMEEQKRFQLDVWSTEKNDKKGTWCLPKTINSFKAIGKSLKESADELMTKGTYPKIVFHDMLNMTNFEVGIPTEGHLIELANLADSDGELSRILKILPGPCHPDNAKWSGEGDYARCDPTEIAKIAHQVQLHFFQGNELCLTNFWQEKFCTKGIAANIAYPRFTVYGCGSQIKHRIIARVLICNHSDCERVMRQHIKKDSFNEIQTFANVANTPDNDSWRSQRNVLLCPFQPDTLRDVFLKSVDRARYMNARLKDLISVEKSSHSVDMNDFLVTEALAHLLEVMIGMPRSEAEDLNEIIRLSFAVEFYLKRDNHQPELARAIKKILNDLPHLDGPISQTLKLSEDLLSEHCVSDKAQHPHVQVGNLMNILHVGHTNVGYTLAFLLLELSRHPEVQEKLRDSIQNWWHDISRSKKIDDIVDLRFEHLRSEKLDILDRCITETIRLWNPVATGSFRVLEFDEVIASGGGTCKLPKGTFVNTPIWQRHRDKKLWGEDSHCFRPLTRDFEKSEISRISVAYPRSKRFAPFGYSPRACPAAQLSGLQTRLIVLHLFRDFRFDLASPYKEAVGPGLNIPTCQPNANPDMFRGVVRGAMGPLDLERKISHSWGTQYLAGLRCNVHILDSNFARSACRKAALEISSNAGVRYVHEPNSVLLRTSLEKRKTFSFIQPATIPQRFIERIREPHCKNLVALREVDLSNNVDSERSWTWHDYYLNVEKVAMGLIHLDIQEHTPVAILANNSPEWYFAAMGAIFSSLIAFGIYPSSLPHAIAYILNHSKAPILFVDSVLQEQKVLDIAKDLKFLRYIIRWGVNYKEEKLCVHQRTDSCDFFCLTWDEFLQNSNNLRVSLQVRMGCQSPGNCCYISYTSGTTGFPKAVMHSHDTLLWGMGRLLSECKIQESSKSINNNVHSHNKIEAKDRRELSFLPCCHVAGTLQIIGPLTSEHMANTIIHFAAPSVNPPLSNHDNFVSLLKKILPTSFWGVPRIWEKLQITMMSNLDGPNLDDIGLNKCRFATTGSAPTSQCIFDFFKAAGLYLCECYAMTENAMYSHLAISESKKKTLNHENSEMQISKINNEILLKSRAIMMGYLYMPNESSKSFTSDGFFKTGDVGKCDESGYLEITGRLKDLIITSGGENVPCAPTEAAILKELPALSRAVLVGDEQKFLIVLLTAKVKENRSRNTQDHILVKSAQLVDEESLTVSDAQNSNKWKRYIDKGICEVNSQSMSRVSQIKRWVLLDPYTGDFSPFGKKPELTPTGKVRRSVVIEKFSKEINMCYNGKTEFSSKDDDVVPTVVIGGGIGGLYYVKRKMQADPNMKPIHIYEAADRLGGKFQTSHSYGINVEYGPLRYEWGIQPLLESLIEELKVPLVKFPSFCGGSSDPDLSFIKKICNILWFLRQKFYDRSGEYKNIESITAKDMDEVNDKAWLPYKKGLVYPHEVYINVWLNDFSPKLARQYSVVLKQLQALNVHDDTLLLWLIRWTKVLVANDTIRTCQRGNQSLIDALANKIPEDTIHLNHKLVRIEDMNALQPGTYRCVFENGAHVRTQRIILAIPPPAVQRLEFKKSKRANHVLASLRSLCLGRQYIYIQNPPWIMNGQVRSNLSDTSPTTDSSSLTECNDLDHAHHSLSESRSEILKTPNVKNGYKMRSLPCRAVDLMENIILSELYCREAYIYDGVDEYGVPVGLLMLYFKDDEHFEFWRTSSENDKLDLIKQKLDFTNVGSEVNLDIPKILKMETVMWDNKKDYPFAFHFLDQTDPSTAQESMAMASKRGDFSISAISDAYSLVPGFCEGVLLNVDFLLKLEKKASDGGRKITLMDSKKKSESDYFVKKPPDS